MTSRLFMQHTLPLLDFHFAGLGKKEKLQTDSESLGCVSIQVIYNLD